MTNRNISVSAAWVILFERYDILNQVNLNGTYRITSAEINTVKEARLMARFDNIASLPPLFRDNNLSILPVTRGDYLIGRFKTHHQIEYGNIRPLPVAIPDLETLDYTNLYSESSALLFAYNSGIIQDIMESVESVHFTVNGRMSSGTFDFRIKHVDEDAFTDISVINSQVEIDAGYESDNAFYIFEAKNVAASEMIIRQLYYPYRLWKDKINKPVIPVFLVFSNDVFHAFVYRFAEDDNYNSIELLYQKSYSFDNQSIFRSDVDGILDTLIVRREPDDISFPQANSFERIVDLLSLLFNSPMTKDEVTSRYVFNERQTDYYITACVYLDLVKRERNTSGETIYRLTTSAQTIMRKHFKEKYLGLIRRILEFPVFNETYSMALHNGRLPTVTEIYDIMSDNEINVGDETRNRRASTVRNWIYWIISQFDD
ncbi:MAG: hypothetical protein AB9921_02550 [Erysipelotrichaceae bacterium]